jgi:hypothetical protein
MMPKPNSTRKDEENIIIIVQALAIAIAYFFEWLFSPSEDQKSK